MIHANRILIRGGRSVSVHRYVVGKSCSRRSRIVGNQFCAHCVKGAKGGYIIIRNRITNITCRIGYQAGGWVNLTCRNCAAATRIVNLPRITRVEYGVVHRPIRRIGHE